MASELFERATRLKVRYETAGGIFSVEDLWDLPLTATTKKVNLDEIAINLDNELGSAKTKSFVHKTTAPAERLQVAFDVVKHIIGVRMAEVEAKEAAELSKQRRARILEIIESKENEQLGAKSLEELRALANQV